MAFCACAQCVAYAGQDNHCVRTGSKAVACTGNKHTTWRVRAAVWARRVPVLSAVPLQACQRQEG